jgi:hypothetical protein
LKLEKPNTPFALILSFSDDLQIGQVSLSVVFAMIIPNRGLALDQVGKDKILTLTRKRGGD